MVNKKKKKTGRRSIRISVCVILVLTLILLSLRITSIRVEGNKKYTTEQIEAMLFSGSWGKNSLVCYFRDRFQPHSQIPFVEDYDIVFRDPFHVEVILYEKSVVGYVSYMSSYMYFDKDGIIVESSSRKLAGIPWITGLSFGQIVLNRPLPVDNQQIFQQIMNLTQDLSTKEIAADKIQYDDYGNATLTIGDIDVYLGSYKDMNGKISELYDILPELANMSGTLYLDTYDETNKGMGYSFIKK